MSGYFLYHSIGQFPGKDAAIRDALTEFATIWSRPDDGQWPAVLDMQAHFLDGWARLMNAPRGTLAQAESVTAALHLLLRGLPENRLRGGKLLVAADCFPSLHFLLAEMTRRLGMTLVTVTPAPGEAWVSDERMLAHWDRDVRLALLTFVTSTSAHKSDVARLCAHGRAMGSLSVVDVTQGIGIAPYDAAMVGADASIGSSLKWLCGVSGAAVLQVSEALLPEVTPELRGWFSQDNPFRWDLDAFAFAPDARRFGNGTPSVLPAVGSLPGLDFVLSQGVAALAQDNAAKGAQLAEWIARAGLRLASPADPAQRGGGLMVELPETVDPGNVVAQLRAEALHTDARGAILRLSPGIVTARDDITRLTETLGALLGQKAEV